MSPLRHILALLALAAAALAAAPLPDPAQFDGPGRLRLLSIEGRVLPLNGELRIAGPGWAFYGAATPWSVTGVTFAVTNGDSVWTGLIPLDNGGRARYEQRVRPAAGGTVVDLTVTAENDFATEGFFYYVQLPIRSFSEAQVTFLRGTAPVARAAAPLEYQPGRPPRFIEAPAADGVALESAAEKFKVTLALGAPRELSVQDDRAWGTPTYSLLIPFFKGLQAKRGQTARLRLTVGASGDPDREAVEITLSGGAPGPAFEGFGGNFVYGLESPVAAQLIERLAPVRARIEMPLYEWEPENDNASAAEPDWARFTARDAPGSTLRRRFELARDLAARGVPLTISVWDLPEWMYEGAPRGRWASRRTVSTEMWPEVLESAGAYLAYLKNTYNVEPELFSFNEPETGVRVLFSAEQHREMILRFGERFARLGLKTKILLADVAEPRGTESYGVYAVSDPDCARHIGAVAFHSWGGASPAEYAAWPALARRFGLPLDVAELGWDAAAWRTPHDLKSAFYALQESRLVLDVLAHARPRSVLLWEYADDYPLLMPGPDGALEPTLRLRVFEQLIRLTPKPAQPLQAASSRADVPVAAYRGGTKKVVVHLVNAGAARKASVRGVPAGVAELKAAILPLAGGEVGDVTLPVKDGMVDFELPAWSLVSLTD
jgi:hypothetical protein